jgi:phospholipid/cholesterol/gamma-HCH transport system permease protein
MGINTVQVAIDKTDLQNIKIIISGRLDYKTTANIWQQCLDLQDHFKPKALIVNIEKINYCDGAGIGLLLELEKLQKTDQNNLQIVGLSSRLKKLMAMISEKPTKDFIVPSETNVAINVGRLVVDFWHNICENVVFLGKITVELGLALRRPRSVRWKDFWRVLEEVGPNATLLIALIGFLVGLITAFQSAIPLGKFGATIYIASLVGIGLVREMGPLMTAVLVAGRTASAFAAEIGTMKVNQEIDALTTMGIEPVKFLVIPRILAAAAMTPLLNLFLIFFGLVGSMLVMKGLGYNLAIFIKQLRLTVGLTDFAGGMVKTVVFGIAVAGIGCLHGIKTRIGASAVGYSTTQSVVSSIVMLAVVDGVFAYIYYVLGV